MKKILNLSIALLFTIIASGIFTNSAHASTNPRVYVTNDTDGTVSVINSNTNAVITTITVGQFPRGAVVSPDGSRVYVSNFTDCCSVNPGSVSVIDTSSYTVIATIPVGNNPTGITITPDGSHVYVANYGFGAENGSVSVINTATNTVTTTITVPPGPWNMAMSNNGTRLYVSSASSNAISVIDTGTNAVLSTISVPNSPAGMVLNPSGSRLFVANQSVSVIDTATNAILTTIPTDPSTGLLAINSTGTRVYASANDKVLVVDAINNVLITSIPMTPVPGQLAILPDDSKVYVPIDNTNTTSVIDTASNTVTASVIVGTNPVVAAVEKPTPPVTTVTFDDRSANTPLNGSYAGINWGIGVWDIDPTNTTNSISFHTSSVTSGTFSFSSPSVLLSTQIYSNSNQTALITLSCSGNNPVSLSVAPNSTAILTTNWVTPCTTVTATSSNSWNTNLDNLVYSSIQNPGVTPNPTPTPPPGTTGGYTTQGALLDTGDAGYMNGSKFTTNHTGGTATSMSVFVGNVDAGNNNKYQMAIYSDNAGNPGTLRAKTATGMLTPLSWNSLPITATLSANTTYWLMYNTNATTSTNYLNNMYFETDTQGIAAWARQSFGTWPTTFPTPTLDTTKFSLYVTY